MTDDEFYKELFLHIITLLAQELQQHIISTIRLVLIVLFIYLAYTSTSQHLTIVYSAVAVIVAALH